MLLEKLPQWAGVLLGLVVFTAALTDQFKGKIPNLLTLPVLAVNLSVLIWCAYSGHDFSLLRDGFLGLGFAFLLFFAFFILQIFGAGDGKLFMALAPLLGLKGTWELVSRSILIASVGALVLLIRDGRVRVFLKAIYVFLRSLIIPGLEVQWPRFEKTTKVPFAPAIFLAYVIMELRLWH